MRILCLPGAYGSAEKFQVQLAPIVKELTEDGTATFHFINGQFETTPPEGFEEYFGHPPYYRFMEPDNKESKEEDDVLARIRDFPDCETPEDTMRELMKEGVASSSKSGLKCLDYLLEIMEREGPFDAIIGYSEGATVASTLLLHEHRRAARLGIQPMFKYAIFFAGWPPIDPDDHHIILSDESEEIIEIPTCHIIGSLDPYLHGSLALYNVCDPDTAHLFDHAKGHTLPRDRDTVKELGDVIRAAIQEYSIDS